VKERIAMQSLTGKVIVVCGGGSGIGAASARRLGEEGARVVVGDINAAGAKQTAATITDAGGSGISVEFDLADDDSVAGLIGRAVDEWGTVHGLFNCGADVSPDTIGRDVDLLAADFAVWRRTLEVNWMGFARSARAVIPLMLEEGGGAIVNTSSGAAFGGEPTRPAYAASKAAINTLTRHIATKWGKAGIRCNSVSPGAVLSETLLQTVPAERRSLMLEQARSPRLGEPSDIAAAVAFLLSDDAEWINGQVWTVDGGALMRQ
jgi:NAD(P)-dependent dehydrogenase (short-subunit alcohol dehydrogenase family)